MSDTEIKLHNLIKELYQELKGMYPKDGLKSPRDIELVYKINKHAAIMDHVQDAMRVINPDYEIRE